MKRKKNRASDPPPPVAVDVEDDDPRLARRLRRRSVALQSSKLHSQRNYGLSNCNMALAEVARVDYILLDDDDDDGGENHAHLDFSQSLGECDQAPTKIPSVKCDQNDVDAEEGKFEDVGSRPNVGEIHKVASISPISKFSHIDDENRGERTHINRVSSEELDIDYGLFCSALDSKQLAKECSIHNENGGGRTHNNEEEREEVGIDYGCFCNLVDVKCGTSNIGSTGVVVTEIVEHSYTNKGVVTGGFVGDVALDDNVAYFPPFATCNTVPIDNCFMQVAFSENVDDFIGSGVMKNIDMVAAADADHDDRHNDDTGDDMDPDYKMYIEKLRQNGDSYFLEAPTINGVMEIFGYEACNEQYESVTVENPKAMGTIQASKQTNDEREFRSCYRRYKTKRQRRERKTRDKMGTRGDLRSGRTRVTENLVVEEKMKKFVLDPISSELNDHVSNRSSARVLGSVNSKIENMDVVDETYRNFLNCVRQEGSYVVFAPKNGKEIVLEKYEESSVDSEVIVVDVDPFSDDAQTPFVTSKYILVENDECIENSIGKSCLRFRDGVMEILEKPFDEKEYQDLLNEATLKRKVVRDKELRSGPKQFQLPGPGKSYLDQHRDLAAIIDSSENDKPKVLNLLRGFFYWLQGLTGLLQAPIKEAEKRGLPGVLSGIALGVTGLVAKPAASILEVTGKTAQSIRNSSKLYQVGSQKYRIRLPRPLSRELPLRPYILEEAVGTSVLMEVDGGLKLKDEVLITCKSLKQPGKFVLLTERLMLVVSCSSLADIDKPEFRGIPVDIEWSVESEIGLDSVIHVDGVGGELHIVASSTDVLISENQHQSKRSGSSRKMLWNNPSTPFPLLQTNLELASEQDAGDFLVILLSTIEQGKGRGRKVLHQSNIL